MVNTAPRIAFIGWNPFQLLHVRKLIKALPGACFVLEMRKEHIHEFGEHLLNDPDVPVLAWDKKRIAELDGMFDLIVCQTLFTDVHRFQKTRIAMIQYGYAKEAHNYGAWRSLADVTLTYGEYAAEKISHFSPVAAVGNPRYDDWFDNSFRQTARSRHGDANGGRKTVLYAPTWGDLSSVDKYLSAVYELADEYRVLLKMHHNTELLEKGRKGSMGHREVKHLGANDDLLELLAVADVVISDYSGAIFDAMFCEKPIVLLDTDVEDMMGHKLDLHSLEYSKRDVIGLTVQQPDQLRRVVGRAVEQSDLVIGRYSDLRRGLFDHRPGATIRAAAALTDAAAGKYVPQQHHTYVRKEMLDLQTVKAKLATELQIKKTKGVKKPGVSPLKIASPENTKTGSAKKGAV